MQQWFHSIGRWDCHLAFQAPYATEPTGKERNYSWMDWSWLSWLWGYTTGAKRTLWNPGRCVPLSSSISHSKQQWELVSGNMQSQWRLGSFTTEVAATRPGKGSHELGSWLGYHRVRNTPRLWLHGHFIDSNKDYSSYCMYFLLSVFNAQVCIYKHIDLFSLSFLP